MRLFSSTTTATATINDAEKEGQTVEVYQELQWLSREIRRHDALYYNDDNTKDSNTHNNDAMPTMMITDDDYDALVRREEEICRKHPDLQTKWEQESGWGKEATRVGGRVGIRDESTSIAGTTVTTTTRRFQKRTHLVPMLSLDNVTNKAQLDAWLERLFKKISVSNNIESNENIVSSITILTEPKLDGLSLSLRYKLSASGKNDNNDESYTYNLVWACTRGDGKKGQDVTQPVREGMKLPTTLKVAGIVNHPNGIPDILEIRGEVVLPRSTFLQLKEQAIEAEEAAIQAEANNETAAATNTLQRFSNARNAASGILLRKASEAMEEKDVAKNETIGTPGTTTLELQSMLQFYAYDMVTKSGATKAEWLEDALSSRQQLQNWGFSVSNPAAVTTLHFREIKNDTITTENDNHEGGEDSSEVAPIEFEPWTEQDIEPMLKYHVALGEHRNEMQKQDKVVAKPKKRISKKDEFTFGDYDMDGCVHKVSQLSLRRLLGNSNRAPRWATAHKFPALSVITALLDIEIQVGRKSGALTPVAILAPVEMGDGVTVTRATLHNFQHMQQLFFGKSTTNETMVSSEEDSLTPSVQEEPPQPIFLGKGSKVLVRRAGDVIPQVVQLAEPPKQTFNAEIGLDSSSWIDISAPPQCPACGSPTVIDGLAANGTASKSAMGQILRCSGPPLLCPPRAIGALVHAYSRDALDLSGLSESKIQQLSTVNSSLCAEKNNETDALVNPDLIILRYPSDIFKLAKSPTAMEAIASLPGWGPKSSQNLANTANKVASDGVSLSRFINSLAIRFAGVHSSKIIAAAYGSVGAFLDAVDHASQLDTDVLEGETETPEDDRPQPFELLADKDNEVNRGIGPSQLSALAAFSTEVELVQAAKDLARIVTIHDDEDFLFAQAREASGGDTEEDQSNKPFWGLKVVFTGSLGSLDLTRKEAQGLAKSMGAKATPGTISKATDIVVVGEKGGGKKLDAARDLEIQVMELDEFMELVKAFQPDNI